MLSSGLFVTLIVLDTFVALTAIGGGIALATGLEGDRFPREWLEGTPFHSYVMPGLILAVIVGGSALLATFVTLGSRPSGGAFSVLAGILMAGYIVVELIILNDDLPWTRTELIYLVLGFLMAMLGLALWLI